MNNNDLIERLKNLYNAWNTLQQENMPINEELKEKLRMCESDIIKEMLPDLIKPIENSLKPILRKVTLIVEHTPGSSPKVFLPRTDNLQSILKDATEISCHSSLNNDNNQTALVDKKLPPPQVNCTPKVNRDDIAPRKLAPRKRLRVIMPNSEIICESTAIDTMVKVIQKLGVEEVFKRSNSWTFISDSKKNMTHSRSLGSGYYLESCTNTETKKKQLQRIAERLGISLQVDVD